MAVPTADEANLMILGRNIFISPGISPDAVARTTGAHRSGVYLPDIAVSHQAATEFCGLGLP